MVDPARRRRTYMGARAAWGLAFTLLVAGHAMAHGAPPERDFETRVLADQSEDCGGDGQTSVNGGCRGAHDLVALNTREAYDPSLGHMVIFTLAADLGTPSGQTLTDTVTYTAKGTSKSIVFRTTDDQTFTVQGADKVVGPQPLLGADGAPDGTRFTVDAWFQRSDLGLAVGDRMSDFSVTARRGGNDGDVMPGGAYSALGVEQSGDTDTQRTRPFVELRGPVQYLRLTPDPAVTVEAGQTAFVNLQVRNLLSDMAQTVSYSGKGTAHVDIGFHVIGSSSQTYPATMDDAIAAGATEDTHLAVTGREVGTGTVEVTLITDRGGRVTGEVPYEVVPAGQTSSDPPATTSGPSDNGSPGLGFLGLAVVAGAAALRRR